MAGVLAGAVLLMASVAATPAPIRVALPDCTAVVSLPAFIDALRVEMAGSGRACCETDARGATVPVEVQVSIASCDARDGRLAVTVRNPTGERTAAREVSLADLPSDARPRALALAVAEMVRAADRAPRPEPAPAVTEGPVPEAPRPIVGGAANAELRLHATPRTVLWGARLASSLSGRGWRAGLEIAAATGGADPAQGHISLRLVTVGFAVGPRWQLGSAALDAGVAGEIGAAFVNGTASSPGVEVESGSGFVATAGARLGVDAPATGALRFRGLLQMGWTLRGLTGDVNHVPALGAAGAYVLAGVGVGL